MSNISCYSIYSISCYSTVLTVVLAGYHQWHGGPGNQRVNVLRPLVLWYLVHFVLQVALCPLT